MLELFAELARDLRNAGAQFQVVADEATKIEEGAATAISLKWSGLTC